MLGSSHIIRPRKFYEMKNKLLFEMSADICRNVYVIGRVFVEERWNTVTN